LDDGKENKFPIILPPIRNSSKLNKTPQLKKAKLVSKSGKVEHHRHILFYFIIIFEKIQDNKRHKNHGNKFKNKNLKENVDRSQKRSWYETRLFYLPSMPTLEDEKNVRLT